MFYAASVGLMCDAELDCAVESIIVVSNLVVSQSRLIEIPRLIIAVRCMQLYLIKPKFRKKIFSIVVALVVQKPVFNWALMVYC